MVINILCFSWFHWFGLICVSLIWFGLKWFGLVGFIFNF